MRAPSIPLSSEEAAGPLAGLSGLSSVLLPREHLGSPGQGLHQERGVGTMWLHPASCHPLVSPYMAWPLASSGLQGSAQLPVAWWVSPRQDCPSVTQPGRSNLTSLARL